MTHFIFYTSYSFAAEVTFKGLSLNQNVSLNWDKAFNSITKLVFSCAISQFTSWVSLSCSNKTWKCNGLTYRVSEYDVDLKCYRFADGSRLESLKSDPTRHLLDQSLRWKHQSDMWNMFKVSYKDNEMLSLKSSRRLCC